MVPMGWPPHFHCAPGPVASAFAIRAQSCVYVTDEGAEELGHKSRTLPWLVWLSGWSGAPYIGAPGGGATDRCLFLFLSRKSIKNKL